MIIQPNKSLGHGVGLRTEHFPFLLENKPKVDWFEAISENFMDTEGRPVRILEKIRENYPIGLHGTSLSIGSAGDLNPLYLKKLKKLVDRIQPAIVSDHICWSEYQGKRLFDLLPLPCTHESLEIVCAHVDQLQNYLGRRILLENVSSYVAFKHSEMTEWEFLNEVARQSGCGILLDINNIYVNSFNHGFKPADFLQGIDSDLVFQYHISGHTDHGKFLFDTHVGDVIRPVWDLYAEAMRRFGDVSSLIEWDTEIKSFEELMILNEKSREIAAQSQPVHQPAAAKAVQIRPPLLVEVVPALGAVQEMFAEEMLGKSKTKLNEVLNEQAGDPGIDRVTVYAGGYPARICEALSEAYPAILKVLGEKVFAELSEEYGRSRNFAHYNLNSISEYFPEFLRNMKWNEEFPFLRDLAELELAVQRSFHAATLPAATGDDFAEKAGTEGELLVLKFQPHVFGVRSHWPILDIWKARNLPTEEIKIQVEGRAQAVLVFRAGEQVVCHLAHPIEIAVLQELAKGEPLGKAFDLLTEAEDLAPVQKWFSGWILNGLLAKFE